MITCSSHSKTSSAELMAHPALELTAKTLLFQQCNPRQGTKILSRSCLLGTIELQTICPTLTMATQLKAKSITQSRNLPVTREDQRQEANTLLLTRSSSQHSYQMSEVRNRLCSARPTSKDLTRMLIARLVTLGQEVARSEVKDQSASAAEDHQTWLSATSPRRRITNSSHN